MSDDQPTRLRDEADSFEQELLRAGAEDAPPADAKTATMAHVLELQRRELSARRGRAFVAGGAAVALAAGALLVLRAPKPSVSVLAEPPPSHSVLAVPVPSGSEEPVSPLAPCSPVSVGSGHDLLIDDFEDGDTRLLVVDKRAGNWVAFNDGTGSMSPRMGAAFPAARIPGGRGESHFGLHTHGGKFTKWGAVLSVELSPRRCYDASKYAGIAFWARGKAQLRVAVKMTQVVAEEFGGSCVKDCFDGHGAERVLTKDWQRYEVRWEELVQNGFGNVLPFDPRSLFSIELAVPASRPAFDYWVDDVSFLPR
jgi:hypothetical protein